MAIRKTCKWCIIILFLLIASGAGYGYYFWRDSNRLLLEKVRLALSEVAPKWKIDIESARYDWYRRIHLYGVTLRDPIGEKNMVSVPEIVLTVDREKLTNDQKVLIQHVHVKNPTIHLTRDANDQWNWKALPPLPIHETVFGPPDWSIENGSVTVELSFPGNYSQQSFELQNTKLQVVPTGRGQYSIQGEIVSAGIGSIQVTGKWNLGTGGWSIDGNLHNQTSIENIVDFTAKVSPKLRTLLDVISPKEVQQDADRGFLKQRPPNQGAQGAVKIGFKIAQQKKGAHLEYLILTKIERAQMAHPALPFPLYDIEGQIVWNHQRVVIQNLKAGNADTKITLNGQIDKDGAGRIDLDLQNLVVNSKLRRHLPQSWLRSFDSVRPDARLNIAGAFSLEKGQKWKPSNFVINVNSGSMLPQKFSYPVQNLKGTIVQKGNRWDLDVRGTASAQPVSLIGRMIDLGPRVDAYFDIVCPSLPIDQTFLKACQPELRRSLEKLSLRGSSKVRLQLYRPAGLNRQFHTKIEGDFRNASMSYRLFPYRISELSGHVDYDSQTQRWLFRELKGNHGKAKLTGEGSLSKRNGKSSFELTLAAENVPFNQDLKLALESDLRDLWDRLSPRGTMSLSSKIRWLEGQPVIVSLPSIRIFQGGFRLAEFPYDWNRVSAHLSWDSSVLQIYRLEGFHKQTKLNALGFVEINPLGEWKVRLNRFKTKDLVTDRTLRKALPVDLRTLVETLNPQGKFSMSGMLEMRGTERPTDPVTAAWDLLFELPNNSIEAGVQLREVKGTIAAHGKWDGTNIEMLQENRIALERAKVWDYQLRDIRGPYRVNNQQLLVGSEIPFQAPRKHMRRKLIDPRDQLTAKAIGGVITLDSLVDFRDRVSYQARLQMHNGNLGQYARTYYPETKNVKGVTEAWIDIWGTGSGEEAINGRGQIRISPAALYELPVFFQMLKVMNRKASPNNSAFKYAFAEFSLRNRAFQFNRIDLAGDTVNMRGGGWVDFDNNLALNFYSELPREKVPIYILSDILRNATRSWVGVEIRGKTGAPTAKIRALPQLDDAFQAILKSLPTTPLLSPGLAPLGLLPRQLLPRTRPSSKRPAERRPNRISPKFRNE